MPSEFVRDPETKRGFFLRCAAMAALVCAALAIALAPGAALARETQQEKDAKAEAADEQATPAPTGDEVGAPMACAPLAVEKYPFLTCVRGVSGGPVFATVGAGVVGQRLELQDKFVKGDGHWGPSGLE